MNLNSLLTIVFLHALLVRMFRELDIPQLHSQINHLKIHGVKTKQINILKIQTKKQTLDLQSYEKKKKNKKTVKPPL